MFGFAAIRYGTLSLTSLIGSYSLIIPTFYGLFFDRDDVKGIFYIGLAFLALSLFSISNTKGGAKMSLKWLVFVVVSFVRNGFCSIIQPEQTEKFAEKYNDTFMVVALAVVFVFLLIVSLTKDKKVFLPTVKTNAHLMILCSLANGITNLLVMVATQLDVNKSLMFPLISAGRLIISWIVSVLIYKEKFSKRQNFGVILGIVAIVLLNLGS